VRHHLYVRVYAGIVTVGVLCVVVVGWLSHVMGPADVPDQLAHVADVLADDLRGPSVGEGLARLGARLDADLALYDEAKRPLASHGAALPIPAWDGPPVQWRPSRDGPVLSARLSDGRWLVGRAPWRQGHVRLPVVLAAVAVTVALGAWPLARSITRRLERLEAAVRAWGSGALGERVHEHGRDEIGRLARAFNQGADRIQALVEGQRRTLAVASHELRSPLARMRVAVELEAISQVGRTEIERDIGEIDALVGELLVAARLDAGTPIDRAPVELLAIAAQEGARVGAMIDGAPWRVDGDARLLRRLVRNLVENARRYARAEVHVRVEPGRLRVEDDGPGVPAEERERTWEPFLRVSGHREGSGGNVGLGLSLVRQIAERHGLRARYEPREGGGSRFVVESPGAT
jgi:signal transduction histidine kinase